MEEDRTNLFIKAYLVNKMKSLDPPLIPEDNYIFKWSGTVDKLLSKFSKDEIVKTIDWVFECDSKFKPRPPSNPYNLHNIINSYRNYIRTENIDNPKEKKPNDYVVRNTYVSVKDINEPRLTKQEMIDKLVSEGKNTEADILRKMWCIE